MFCTHRPFCSVAHRTLFSPLLLLIGFLVLALVSPAEAQSESLDITVTRSPITEANPNKGAYSGIVKGGQGPYEYFWIVYDPQGKQIPGAELSGTGPYVPDFDYTIPNKPGHYTVKLVVKDKNKNYGTGVSKITMGKASVKGGPAPISDLTPIIDGPNFVEAGQEFQITWDAQGSGVGKVGWEWHTPKGVLKNKGLKGKLAQPDRELTVTLLAWDNVIPKSNALRQTHVVRSVKPLDVQVITSGVKRLGPREFQVQKDKPFKLTAIPKGGVGKNYKVKWGSRAEGRDYANTVRKTGSGTIKLAIRDEGRWQTTPKTWDLTIKSVEKTTTAAAQDSGIAGWWIYLRGKERVPVIINPVTEDGTYTGVYFPEMTTKSLVQSKDTLVAHLKMFPRGGSWYYKYSYNDGRDKGDGTMSGGGSQMSGPWKSEGGATGNWTWVRPGTVELQKLRQHFGRG
jgi:hypothetical protein